jgi:hypothetical protein
VSFMLLVVVILLSLTLSNKTSIWQTQQNKMIPARGPQTIVDSSLHLMIPYITFDASLHLMIPYLSLPYRGFLLCVLKEPSNAPCPAKQAKQATDGCLSQTVIESKCEVTLSPGEESRRSFFPTLHKQRDSSKTFVKHIETHSTFKIDRDIIENTLADHCIRCNLLLRHFKVPLSFMCHSRPSSFIRIPHTLTQALPGIVYNYDCYFVRSLTSCYVVDGCVCTVLMLVMIAYGVDDYV